VRVNAGTGEDGRRPGAGGTQRSPGLVCHRDGHRIVSAALRQAGGPRLSGALLALAAASFVILLATSAWRAAAFPADLLGDLRCLDRACTCCVSPPPAASWGPG